MDMQKGKKKYISMSDRYTFGVCICGNIDSNNPNVEMLYNTVDYVDACRYYLNLINLENIDQIGKYDSYYVVWIRKDGFIEQWDKLIQSLKVKVVKL